MSNTQKNFYETFFTHQKRSRVEQLKQDLRLRVIKKIFEEDKKLRQKTLIAGCGWGEDTLISKNALIACDLSMSALQKAKQLFPNHFYAACDAEHLPFASKSFDCIVCSEVLEHLPSPGKVLNEFHRLLKIKGSLIISVPNWISWYGLARKIGEWLLKRPLTAGGQPIDNWWTFTSLQKELAPYFQIARKEGIWYYPPPGKDKYTVPDRLIFPLLYFFQPLDRLFGLLSPAVGGHIIALKCSKKEDGFNKE